MHASIATLPRIFLSVGRALFSRKNGMKAGDLHVMKHVVNRRWFLEGLIRPEKEGTPCIL